MYIDIEDQIRLRFSMQVLVKLRVDVEIEVPEVPTFTDNFCCGWACDDIIHVPPGGSVTYIDSDGITQTENGLCGNIPVSITYRSIIDLSGSTSIC